jgi:ArsR family transcriptional regulator
MDALTLTKCLADETRIRVVLLLLEAGEMCVCDLTEALEQPQPKVSRHLAQLRGCALIQARRHGKWMFYRLHPQLPLWAIDVLDALRRGDTGRLRADRERLLAPRLNAAVDC